MDYELDRSVLPTDFEYPHELRRIVQLGLVRLEPWHIMYGERLHRRYQGLAERYPARTLVPFAKRQDNDDVACWDGLPPGVVVIHDFASPGWEQRATFPDFYAWFRQAIDDLIAFE